MKKSLSSVLALMLSLTCLVGCNTGDGNSSSGVEGNKPIDPGKTQLSISNYDGAFGTEWLYLAARRFEQKYANTEFEANKKGVQITVDPIKTVASGLLATMQDSATEIYFNEQAYYYDAVSTGKFLDITDIVTENLLEEHGEDATIESKLTAEQQNYFKTADGKYYGLPHYMGFMGLTYDIDLFEQEGFYIAKDGSFVKPSSGVELGYGPDGVKDTYDDGLPATYDDFFRLCARIKQKGATPLTWAGSQKDGYVKYFLTALQADYEGLDQMMLNYTFDGTATNIVSDYSIDGNGKISNMQLSSVDITRSNGYELSGQAGKAYAISFLEQILKGNYYHSDGTDGSVSHLEGQYGYLESRAIGSPIAMFLDGSFWYNEARENGSFDMVAGFGDQYKKENRRFGFMPLPKAEAGMEGKQTLTDYLYSCAFINANIAPEKEEVAKLFLQFLYTDESLREFTVTTNAPKSVKYDMGDRANELSVFGKSVWDNFQNADIVYPYASNNLYLNNQSKLNTIYLWVSKIGTATKNIVMDALYQDKVSSKDYFLGIKNNYNQTYWNNNFSAYFD